MANTKNFDHVSHIKSKLTRDIVPEEFYGLTPTADNSDEQGSSPIKLNLAKRPTADKLVDGEIAVNYKKGHETLTIKNDQGEIVGFVNENDFNQAQEIVALGLNEEKNQRERDVAILEQKVGNVENIQNELEEMDLVTSAALNDLNDRLVDLDERFNEEMDVMTNIVNQTTQELSDDISQMDLVVSSALNDLNSRINGIDPDSLINRLNEFDSNIEDMELTISSSLNDLNTRVIVNVSMLNDLFQEISDLKERVAVLESQS